MARVFLQNGEAEVHDLGRDGVGEEDIARLDVAMNQPAFERGLEALGDLDAHGQDLHLGQAVVRLHQPLQRAFIHQFHGDIDEAIVLPGAVDLDDVRVVDRSGDRGFLLKLGDEFRFLAVGALEELECDRAAEREVERVRYTGAHASGTQFSPGFQSGRVLAPHPYGGSKGAGSA